MAPPPNDLLVNAELVGKGYRSFSGTTVDATFSDEGTAGYDQPSVWYEFDTTILQHACPFWVSVDASYAIYAEVYSFDGNPTDGEDVLLNGDFIEGIGDGTNTPPPTLCFPGTGDVGANKRWFMYVSDWDFDGTEGTFDFEVGVPWSVRAFDNPNNASPTVTVLVDAVKDTQMGTRVEGELEHIPPFDLDESFYSDPMPTGGKFYFGFRARSDDTGTPLYGTYVLQPVRNGFGMGIPRYEDSLDPTFEPFWPHEQGGTTSWGLHRRMYPLWVQSGDTIGFRIATDDVIDPGDPVPDWMEVGNVTFYPAAELPYPGLGDPHPLVDEAQDPAPSLPTMWTLPELNLGATTELFSMTFIDHGDPTTDVYDVPGRDFVLLDDGTIYAGHQEWTRPGFVDSFSTILQKWNGSSWTILDNDLWDHGTAITTHATEGGLSMDSDGEFVYIAWAERDIAANERYWRCKRLDISDDSITELGPSTGTSHYANSTRKRFAAGYHQSLRVKVSPAGVPWVGWAEIPTDDIDPPDGPNQNSNLPFLYYWDGAAWVDSEVPEPPTMRTPWWDICIVEEAFPHIDFTFCHADGPSEYPSVIYNVQWDFPTADDGREFVYWEYDGATWSNGFQERAGLFLSDLVYPSDHGHWHQGMSMQNDGSKPLITAVLGSGAVGFDYVASWSINDTPDAFEASDTPYVSAGNAVLTNDGGWTPYAGESVYANGNLYVVNNHDFWTGYYVTGQGEYGDTTGWYGISHRNYLNWDAGILALSPARIRYGLGKLWLMAENYDGVLGIWVLTPIAGGVVSMNWRSSDRRGSANRVLVGDR